MGDRPVCMGGIVDLATSHTEDVFNPKSPNESSPDSGDGAYPLNKYVAIDYEDPDGLELQSKSNTNSLKKKSKILNQPSELPLGPMIWSISSSVAETPGDSGVQCLDSETSDLTGDCPAGMTLSLVEAEELTCDYSCDNQSRTKSDSDGDLKGILSISKYDVMTQSDIENQNCGIDPVNNNCYDLNEQSTSGPKKNLETMKSASDDIVYRRKCKKKSNNQSQPKKRVSFHEDILNNTRTDNIHIEHGFISYRPEISMNYFPNNYFKKINNAIGRYSWCADGDSPYVESQNNVSYRNIKSDVLTYGRTDVTGYPDNSGIYEYQTDNNKYFTNKSCDSDTCINKIPPCKCSKDESQKSSENNSPDQRQLYICSCSSSDSNLSSESETSSQTLSLNSTDMRKYGKKCDNTQKSYSCDCIENNSMKPLVKTMYFSDANINDPSDKSDTLQMSEILSKSFPKKSALKKKRYVTTNVIEEHQTKSKIDRDKIKSLLDSKNLFGSLKNIYKNINFGLSIAERGVPEGSEDCQSVSEVLPGETFKSDDTSKSYDINFDYNYQGNEIRLGGDGLSSNYNFETDTSSSDKEFVKINIKPHSSNSKQKLSLDMNATNGKTFMDWKNSDNYGSGRGVYPNTKWLRNKCIVNCESTVYEHKGVSYCYENDTFQTTFDTSKDTFTPIVDTIKNKMISSQTEAIQENTEQECENEPLPMNTIENEGDQDVEDNKPSSNIEDNKISINSSSNIEDNKASNSLSECDNSTESGDKSKFKMNRYLIEQNEASKSGVSKHLSSPLKQRNIMRYEKAKSLVLDSKETDSNFDNMSTQDTVNDSADMDEIMEVDGLDGSKQSTRRLSLINRFLKNVSQKKAFYAKLKQNEFFQRKIKEEKVKFPNIVLPSIDKLSPKYKLAAKYIDSMINKEIMENKRISVKLMTADEPSYFDSFEENVAIECCEKLKLELFRDPSEILQRMLKVRSLYSQENGKWSPQLVFVTDRALYVADVESGKPSYNILCYLTHDNLDVIVIGPDSQYVQIFDKSGNCRCSIITADRYLCHRLVSSLEWCSRNCRFIINNTVVKGSIPSVLWKNRECLRKSLLKTTSYDKYEMCLFYGMVGSSLPASFNSGRPASPFGQPMEGFLMYKTEKQRHWRPSYFLLKSGVLSYGSSTPPASVIASCLPHSIDLKTVIGVRRCTDIHGRPYCFEIALNTGASLLQMAAPDDDVASQWLQGLLMHAAQALEGPKLDPKKKPLPPCCTLLVTSQHIITLREQLENQDKLITNENKDKDDDDGITSELPPPVTTNIEILSFASIIDLTAMKIPDNDDNWCILEFVFCEVHEGTEMGFLFTSSAELERFISIVESIWHTTNDGVFPISIQPSSNITSSRCSEWHNCLVKAWDGLLPAAHH